MGKAVKFFKIVLVVVILLLVSYGIADFLHDVFSKAKANQIFNTKEGDVAIIEVSGDLSFGAKSKEKIEKILGMLNEAEENNKIKAVILSIDSSGGGVINSKKIMEKVKSFKKPIVAFIGETGTSGAYWIASAADKIVADPLAITGSIGVSSSYFEFADALEIYNITYQRLVTGPYKDIGSPYKKLTEEEKRILENKLDIIHNYLVKSIAENRNMSIEQVQKLATGIFYLGIEAKENGLVDELGDIEKALEVTRELANENELTLIKPKEENPGFLALLNDFLTNIIAYFKDNDKGTNNKDITISSPSDTLTEYC